MIPPIVKARDVNTIDEVPDSSWFTNRIGVDKLTTADVIRGPLTGDGPAPGTWSVTRPKETGFAPGFTMNDAKGQTWFVSFDANGFPEAATGAILAANKIFWALGYWQVENYLVHITPGELTIADTALVKVSSGQRRKMKFSDLQEVLRRAQKSPDGTYRAVAAKLIPGRDLGGHVRAVEMDQRADARARWAAQLRDESPAAVVRIIDRERDGLEPDLQHVTRIRALDVNGTG